ncbi:hypothetical protein GCM10023142_08960 [Anaerocolumna aminovalerica]|uniref:Uncharacterized protein n=1 Tax=Anaerocolumna aminovalerica TaxID=1527 RepID=A0A1I5DVX3_9FIRM|nr:hypothetical protein [Anaerocolumna aminovalerica]MBU5332851.1 hypothetical protein [Anaerocolumna aminovalerica]SFO03379.1 hypothetical protein SAMN04489757_10718 [Anaerocolumna aminovalerica]
MIEVNIKMTLNAVMERDSKNPTPLLDKEPEDFHFMRFFVLITHNDSLV